jgi:hypothetical protein
MDAQGLADAMNRIYGMNWEFIQEPRKWTKCDIDTYWWMRQWGSGGVAQNLGLHYRYDEDKERFLWVVGN